MKLMLRAVSAILVASGLTVMGPSAMAVTKVRTHTPDLSIVGDTCGRTVVKVKGNWDNDYSNEIDIDVYGPNGGWQDGKYVTDEFTGVVQLTVRLCDYNVAGKYTVRVKVTGYDEDFVKTASIKDKDTFRLVKKPKRKSVMRGKVLYQPCKAYDYQVPARLMRSGRGYVKQQVLLLVRYEGSWYKVDKTRTRKRGVFGWQFKPNRYTWAYYFDGDKTTKAVGAKFRTPVRGREVTSGQMGARLLSVGPVLTPLNARASQAVASAWSAKR